MTSICLPDQPHRGVIHLTPLEQLAFEGKFAQAIEDTAALLVGSIPDDQRWAVVSRAMAALESGTRTTQPFTARLLAGMKELGAPIP